MPLRSTSTTVRTFDGLHLSGTLVTPNTQPDRAVVLVHGGGVTREEGGFFTRLSAGLCEAGVTSLRYDLRGHGESHGCQEETTLSAHLNDIRVSLAHMCEATGARRVVFFARLDERCPRRKPLTCGFTPEVPRFLGQMAV